jgi:hypothetical protein
MQLKRRIETPDGTFEVDATFTKEEMDVIVDVGLNTMLQAGAIPFQTNERGVHVVIPPHTLEH